MIYQLNEYRLIIPDSASYDTYEDKDFKGINLYINNKTYNIHHNKIGWSRLIINGDNFENKDLPFNEKTLKIIPLNIGICS